MDGMASTCFSGGIFLLWSWALAWLSSSWGLGTGTAGCFVCNDFLEGWEILLCFSRLDIAGRGWTSSCKKEWNILHSDVMSPARSCAMSNVSYYRRYVRSRAGPYIQNCIQCSRFRIS
jgi:hypothetical protein